MRRPANVLATYYMDFLQVLSAQAHAIYIRLTTHIDRDGEVRFRFTDTESALVSWRNVRRP